MSAERERVEQSNEVAGIVFVEHAKAFPDLHPVLDLRYGIADALWDAGYRRTELGLRTDAERESMAIAQNIINQIGDLYCERIPSPDWVKVRQETNDELDAFVSRLIRTYKGEVFS